MTSDSFGDVTFSGLSSPINEYGYHSDGSASSDFPPPYFDYEVSEHAQMFIYSNVDCVEMFTMTGFRIDVLSQNHYQIRSMDVSTQPLLFYSGYQIFF